VVVQLACEVELIRTVNRAVFRPRPRVDSALLRLRRVGPAAVAGVARLVRGSFAHRRKPLASSLELAGGPSRQEVRAALGRLELEPDVRAERLAPAQFAALAAELGAA
jgi:16S rRNA (adenine1518-N6/adenine1519-N6)-dimethyltransferase